MEDEDPMFAHWPPRCAVVAASLLVIMVVRGAGATDPRLAAVNDWLYVLQPSGPADAAAIAASTFDGVVMDYSEDGSADGELSAAQIAAVGGSGKVVLAYMSVGEAEDYRFYWNPAWTSDPPAWLGPENPDWAGNYKVRYWDPGWQAILFGTAGGPDESYLDRILDQGFDGVYLDIVDAFTYWSDDGERTRAQARGDMIALVAALAAYARTSRHRPTFLVLPQNAEDIIVDDGDQLDAAGESYLATIDGIGVEDVFYDELTAQSAGDVSYRAGLLSSFVAAGDVVLSVDYVWDSSAPVGAANINRYNDYKAKARAAGYLPYAAVRDRDLDEILTVASGGGIVEAQPLPGGGVLLVDGFEDGGTAAWSVTVGAAP